MENIDFFRAATRRFRVKWPGILCMNDAWSSSLNYAWVFDALASGQRGVSIFLDAS